MSRLKDREGALECHSTVTQNASGECFLGHKHTATLEELLSLSLLRMGY